jgi:DNA mismatch repair protein MutS
MLSEVSTNNHLFDKSFHLRPGRGIDYVRDVSSYSTIDRQSFEAAELPALHENLCKVAPAEFNTTLGNINLLASLISPPTERIEIHARQEALKEIASNDKLRDSIESILRVTVKTEQEVLGYLSMRGSLLESNGQLRSFKNLEREVREIVSQLPAIQSDLLRQIFSDILEFSKTDEGKIVRGPTLATILGLRPKEKAVLLPRYHYRSAPFDTVTLTALIAIAGSMALPGIREEQAPEILRSIIKSAKDPMVGGMVCAFSGMGLWLWPTIMKRLFDGQVIHIPLMSKLRENPELSTTFGAFGLLGELYTLHCLNKKDVPVRTTPVFTESDRFEFATTELHNPLIFLRGGKIVSNNFTLFDNRLVSIEGSNSGGKTFFCKSAFQTQVLAQLGADVFASQYTCSVAEHFFYHIVSSGTLGNDDGNFGSGLMRAEQLLYDLGIDNKFFAVLDEIAEGTTQTEKIETAGPILHSFRIIGAGILWANHNHELVSMMPSEIVDPWMIEMRDGKPTHKLVRGISKSSGAKRVVTKHRLDPESLRAELDRRGLVYPEKFIGEGVHTE